MNEVRGAGFTDWIPDFDPVLQGSEYTALVMTLSCGMILKSISIACSSFSMRQELRLDVKG